MPTPRGVTIALATAPLARSAAEARTTDPIFAAIKAHQEAWDLPVKPAMTTLMRS